MKAFEKKAVLPATAAQIPAIAESIRQEFANDGFEVDVNLQNDGCNISISKGGIFKAVLGMRTSLNVTLTPQSNGVLFDAHVGIFGQQLIPTAIGLFLFWPVLLTQVWGLIQQSKMDDRAFAAAERGVYNSSVAAVHVMADGYCTNCGAKLPMGKRVCPKCGHVM